MESTSSCLQILHFLSGTPSHPTNRLTQLPQRRKEEEEEMHIEGGVEEEEKGGGPL